VIGGWLTDQFSWRWVFYINVPLGAAGHLWGYRISCARRSSAPVRSSTGSDLAVWSIAIGAMQVFLDRGRGNSTGSRHSRS